MYVSCNTLNTLYGVAEDVYLYCIFDDINELSLLSRKCFCTVDRSNVVASLVTTQNCLLTYLNFSDYVKIFCQRITPSNDVEFMSDELNMTWRIMNELRKLYAAYDSHRLLLAGGRRRGLFVLMS